MSAPNLLESAVAEAPVAIVILSGPMLVVEVANTFALRNWGRSSSADILGRPLFEAVPELAHQGFEQVLQDVRTTSRTFVGRELPLTVIDDVTGVAEQRYIDRVYSRLPTGDHILAVGTDSTEIVRTRLQHEAEIREQEHRLAQADQRKDEFLAMLAHELRNPMAAVSTAIQLLEQVENDAVRSAKYRDTARRQIGNLVRLVDDLLDVSRITRGKIELQRAELELGAIVQQALASTRAAFEARSHGVAVTLAAGSFRMHGDATRLEQIVANLLTNAAKYTEPGGRIEVHLARERIEGRGVQAVLRVRDTGRGIPPDMLDHVFDLFVQVAPSIDRRTGGLGLGLTLVKRLTELHGGTVSALSGGPGHGSEFIVRLPLLDRPAMGTPAQMPVVELPVAARRILLVEDADDVRDTLSAYLRGLGHDVHVASDGLEGVARAAEVRPDLAFVDIGLPSLDGFEVARRVRATGNALYLVALTGYGGDEARAQAREAGFDLHLTKPVDLAALPRLIDRAGRA